MAEQHNQNPRHRGNGEDRSEQRMAPDRQHYVESNYREEPLSLSHLEARFERLYEQVESLMKTELDLAKTEISEKAHQAGKGAAELTTGSIIAFYGGQALVLAAILGLALVVDFWLSALIIGAGLAIVGAILMATGKKDLQPSNLKPEKTMRSMRNNARMAREEF